MSLALRITCLALLAGCPAAAADLSVHSCAGPQVLSGVKVDSVQENGTLQLGNGSGARLEGVRVSPEGISYLRQNLVGRATAFYAVQSDEDRYGRRRVQAALDGGRWIQLQLLYLGLARVDLAPDRPQCAQELYAAEQQARATTAGLWAHAANAVRTPALLTKAETGTFQIVEGRVLSADIVNGRAFLNFGDDYKTDFTVTIAPADRAAFRAAKVDPRKYGGKLVRVRGIIQFYNGPEIEVAAPHQIELLE